MKNLMSIIVVTSLFLFVSTTFSFGQEPTKRTKAELHVVKSEKVRTDVVKALKREAAKSKKVNIDNKKALKKRAKMHSQPAKIEKK